VLEVIGGSEGEAGGVGGKEGGDGSCIGICGFAGEGWADLVLFLWVCRLILAGARRGAACEVVVVVAGGVGKESGCLGGVKGFGVVGFGSFSVEQKASKRPSKQAAKACSKAGTSSGERLGEGVGFAGGGVLAIAAVADRCGAWRQLSWGRKGNFSTGWLQCWEYRAMLDVIFCSCGFVGLGKPKPRLFRG